MNLDKNEIDRLMRDGDFETVEKFQHNENKSKKKKFKKAKRQKPEWKRFKSDAY